jgi:hypothetical protein
LLAKDSTTNNSLNMFSRIKENIPRFNPHICTKY